MFDSSPAVSSTFETVPRLAVALRPSSGRPAEYLNRRIHTPFVVRLSNHQLGGTECKRGPVDNVPPSPLFTSAN
jgi:hypothetical protein